MQSLASPNESFFLKIEQNSKICMELQKAPNSQSNPEKENKVDCKVYCKALVIKTV